LFGHREASSIKITDVKDYIDARLESGAKPATINRELSALRRALNPGVEDGLLIDPPPPIKLRKENNVRKGFIERDVYLRICESFRATSMCFFASATIWGSASAAGRRPASQQECPSFCFTSRGNGCSLDGTSRNSSRGSNADYGAQNRIHLQEVRHRQREGRNGNWKAAARALAQTS
jgi:hypothetical protein